MNPFDKAWALLKMPEVTLAPETMAQYFQPMRLGPAISVLQEDSAQSTIPEGGANTILEQGKGKADGVQWSPQLEVPTSSALSPETLDRLRQTQGYKINTRTNPKALEGQPEGTTHLYTIRPRMQRARGRAPSGRERLGADPEKENWDMQWYEGNKFAGVNKWGRPVNQGWWDHKVRHQNPTREEIARILQEGTTLTDEQDKALFRNLRHRTEEGRKINESLAADRAEAEELGKIIRRLSRAAETETKKDVMRNERPPVASRAIANEPVTVKKPVGVKRRRRLGTVRGGPRRR